MAKGIIEVMEIQEWIAGDFLSVKIYGMAKNN